MDKFRELLEEFRLVFSKGNSILDSVIPPLIFLVANALFGFSAALWASLGVSLVFALVRILRRQPIWYALGGMGAALLAIGLALLLDRAEAYFIPTLINGALMVVILVLSMVFKRPAVAFTSFIVRRWPLDWYWHPRVRPAYTEVTAIWAIFSAAKLTVQYMYYRQGQLDALAVFNLISGWPALIVLLVVSYIYGLKRLGSLQGPGVEEFKKRIPPPWKGQRRGF